MPGTLRLGADACDERGVRQRAGVRRPAFQQMIQVAIDGACWLNRRGYGRFTRSLVAGLAALREDVAYTLLVDFDPADAPPVPDCVRVVRVRARRPAARSATAAGSRSLLDLWTMSRVLSHEQFDAVFLPAVYSYVPVIGPSKVAVVIHDVIP